MKYPFMTMPDETEITHSSIFEENGVEKIHVYIERPVEGGFIDATCILPDYSWQNNGFSDAEIKEFQDILEKGSHLIYKFARKVVLEMPQIFSIGSYVVYFWSEWEKHFEEISY